MTHSTYPHLFTPLDLGHVTLPNRVLMRPFTPSGPGARSR